MINERFFSLPDARQKQIVDAAYRIFGTYDYAHAPTSEIAFAAGISKSLLFHYFGNKQSLYFYLWKQAEELTAQTTEQYGVTKTDNPFEIYRRATSAKCELMRMYPYILAFTLNAYYETDEHVRPLIQKQVAEYTYSGRETFSAITNNRYLQDGLSAADLYDDFLYLSDGYMMKAYRSGNVDANKIERDFFEIIARWERIFGRDNR